MHLISHRRSLTSLPRKSRRRFVALRPTSRIERLEDRRMLSAMLNTSAIGQQAKVPGFGGPVAIEGNTMVVGGGPAAEVFISSGSTWVQVAKLSSTDDVTDDTFGSSIAISGNTVVIGAEGAAVGGNDDQGAAYVFTEPATGWAGNLTQTAKLTASDGAANDFFGVSVSISANTIVVGASNATFGGISQRGAVYVFTAPSLGWTSMTQTAKLDCSDGTQGGFGESVSISGNTIVAGAQGTTIFGHDGQGAAYVFAEPATGWTAITPTATLTASDGGPNDGLGSSVSINGNTAVVADGRSVAYVFQEPATGWANMTQVARLTDSDGVGAFSGFSVAISGNTVVAGASAFDPVQLCNITADDNSNPVGAVYLFAEPDSGWKDMTQTAIVTASDNTPNDNFASSVSISGNTVVVGGGVALVGGIYQSAVYVFGNPGMQPVFRLYSPVTQEHLFTSDFDEYNTLTTRGWTYEGIACNWYSAPATVDGVTDEPMYRLYDPAIQQHLWTTDLNEFITLATRGWTQEGIAGYVFPTAVAASEPLYRLSLAAPALHLWTTDLNEYETLASQDSWSQEGIVGYVL